VRKGVFEVGCDVGFFCGVGDRAVCSHVSVGEETFQVKAFLYSGGFCSACWNVIGYDP